MKALLAIVFASTLSVFSLGDSFADPVQSCLLNAESVAQQQACCTKNKGVCGCRAGKIVCCDKTFAEGCSCARDEEPPIS